MYVCAHPRTSRLHVQASIGDALAYTILSVLTADFFAVYFSNSSFYSLNISFKCVMMDFIVSE